MIKSRLLLLLVLGSVLSPLSGVAAETESVGFEYAVMTEHKGDVAYIEIDVPDTDTATLHVEFRNYDAEVRVTDGNGDGTVVVEMNTYLAGRVQDASSAYGVKSAGDAVSATRLSSRRDELLSTGEYTMRLVVDGREEALGKFVLQQPSLDHVEMWSAPSSYDVQGADFTSLIMAVNERDVLSMDDTAVFEVEVSGIYGFLDPDSSREATAEFAESLQNDHFGFEVVQSNADGGDPKRLDVPATAADDALTVLSDDRNQTLFVVADLSEAVFRQDGSRTTAEQGDTFTAEFSVLEDSRVYEERATAATDFEIAGREVSLDYQGDRVTVKQASSQTISGATSLSPGTELLVKLRSTEAPFLKEETVTVGDDGTFGATFDLSTVVPSDFTVRIVVDGTVLTEVDGEVVQSVETETTAETTTTATTFATPDPRTTTQSHRDDSSTTEPPDRRNTEAPERSSTERPDAEGSLTANSDVTTTTTADDEVGVFQTLGNLWTGLGAVWGYVEAAAAIATLVGTTLTAIRFKHWWSD